MLHLYQHNISPMSITKWHTGLEYWFRNIHSAESLKTSYFTLTKEPQITSDVYYNSHTAMYLAPNWCLIRHMKRNAHIQTRSCPFMFFCLPAILLHLFPCRKTRLRRESLPADILGIFHLFLHHVSANRSNHGDERLKKR